MSEGDWEKALACAADCSGCGRPMAGRDGRVLSVYTHQPICLACKLAEEQRADYSDVAKQMVRACLEITGRPYGDPAGYCFHHFCPFRC